MKKLSEQPRLDISVRLLLAELGSSPSSVYGPCCSQGKYTVLIGALIYQAAGEINDEKLGAGACKRLHRSLTYRLRLPRGG
jgi:hypothetical protein